MYYRGREARPGWRVQWQYYYEPDPQTGKPALKVVWPRHVRVRITTWRDRFDVFGGWDATIGIIALALLVAAAVLP